jgi:diaminohydroxyphosphoribosylaminopyrimidine deaminase / 5-amino-6-(5-phosphoribosylamino)uracil reductase
MDTQSVDKMYMARCLELAQNGQGNVAPNPMVGALIVHNDRIIGEGYHIKFGDLHAEINAINSVKDKSLLKESTLYLSLEPCSHFGKTPPCTDTIIATEIPRIVIATMDVNPKVMGRGIEILRKVGREVLVGIMEDEARDLNRRFFTFQTKKRPYIILKWAQTIDGFIDVIRDTANPIAPIWITNELSRSLVHRWRSEEQAILIGTKTVEKDNPKLNVRDWSGRTPTRVIIDRKLRLPIESNVFDGCIPTLLFIGNNAAASVRKTQFAAISNLEIISIDFAKGMEMQLLKELYDRNINSVMIEGGAIIINSFVQKNLWDEARVFVGNQFFYDGVKAPTFARELYSYDELGDSKLFTYRNRNVAELQKESLSDPKN